MILMLAACTLSGGDKSTTIDPLTDETLGGTVPGLGPDLVVTDANIHSYEAEWRFPAIEIRPQIEIFIDWDGITSDAFGLERTPDSFALLELFEVQGNVPDAVDALASDTLVPTAQFEAAVAGETGVALSDLGGFDPDTQMVEDDGRSWLLALCDDDGTRVDIRDGLFLTPKETQGGTLVSIPQGGALYTWLGQIDGDILRTADSYDAWTVDWSGVTTDGYGKPFDAALGDELFVGRFDDYDEADDLGSQMHDLAAVASGWWTASVGGSTSAALADASGSEGAFPGFEGDVVYVVGVRCTTCLGPAPLWVSGVDVRAQ